MAHASLCNAVSTDQVITDNSVACLEVSGTAGVTVSGTGSLVTGHGILFTAHTAPGGLDNSGIISGSSNGVFLDQGSMGALQNSGAISGITADGINVSGGTIAGSLANSGTIAGQYGIELIAGATIASSVSNTGTMTGLGTAQGIAIHSCFDSSLGV